MDSPSPWLIKTPNAAEEWTHPCSAPLTLDIPIRQGERRPLEHTTDKGETATLVCGPAQPCAGAVQPWRRLSCGTDRSAGGCADRRTFLITRARAMARQPPRSASSWQGRRGQLPAMARAHRRGCHDASAHACDEELSTCVGEKGAWQQVNGCLCLD